MPHRKLTYQELRNQSKEIGEIHLLKRRGICVILENVRSLFNVGAIFRTSDALRIEELILTGYTGRPPRKEIDKAALGSVESVPWSAYKNSIEPIRILKERGVQIVALEQTEDSVDFQSFEFSFPVALILGNEYEGILQETLDVCDYCVEIPMHGVKQSLNVSTAFGILGYELLRRLK